MFVYCERMKKEYDVELASSADATAEDDEEMDVKRWIEQAKLAVIL